MFDPSQMHIPLQLRKSGDEEAIQMLFGQNWRRPKLECDLSIIESLYGPPPTILHDSNLHDYQDWMSDIIQEKPAVYIAAEMGLGKTAAVLRAVRNMLRDGTVTKILIVAPYRVAEETWPEEIAKWSFARPMEYSVITGDEDQRIAALNKDVPIHIINRENLVWLREYWRRKWPYDMLVYDEASRLKSGRRKTKPTKRKDGSVSMRRLSEFGALRNKRYTFKKVVLLSGTPAPAGLIDLWGPIFIIDNGERLGCSMTAYKRRWFDESRYTYGVTPRDHAQDEIMDRIDDVFFSLREEDYLKLPPMIEKDHYVNMPPRDLEKYKRFERDMVLEEFDLEAVNRGVLTNKLLQMANGALYLEDHSIASVHKAKLDALDSIVSEACGAPMLVAYSYKFDIPRIMKKYPFARLYGDNPNDMRDWNAGKIRMLLLHPASAGHGLNFQYGSNICVWYGLTWSLELYQQLIKRLHRQGQKEERVFLHRIITRNTVDERLMPLLRIKGQNQDRITDAVRVQLRMAA
jgi:SNF2 family DNA or RNA helicase